MDLHKSKPVRSWRELLTEIGIIVLSVSIALGAEQAVEWWHWKNRVRDALEAMRLELRDDDGPQAYLRMAMVNCFAGQLDAIQAAVEAGRPRKEIAALVDDYRAPNPTWDSNAWNAILASDVGSHIPASQLIKWSIPYDFVPALDKRNQQERDERTDLQLTHRDGEKLSSAESEAMLTAISRLRRSNSGMRGFSGALLFAMQETGITLEEKDKSAILKYLRNGYHDCVVTPSIVRRPPSETGPSLMVTRALLNRGRN